MDLNKIKTIHFTGIKGVGMTALACIAKDFGIQVTGSDTGESFVTDQILKKKDISFDDYFDVDNIVPNIKQKSENGLKKKNVIDLVVYTAAHKGEENVEVKTAKKLNISTLTFGETLGEFFKAKSIGISVAGVGGKTSTSAMLATVLENAGQNPSYLIGVGEIPSLDFPGKYDLNGDVFIAEADEYACSPNNHRPKFYYQTPKIIILTNLAFDHPDIYQDTAHTLKTFMDFAKKLPHDGLLIANYDSLMVRDLVMCLKDDNQFEAKIITYGEDLQSDWQLVDYNITKQQAVFRVDDRKDQMAEFILNIPGKYNAKNAIATIIASKHLGLTNLQIQAGLTKFMGTKRRFEKIAKLRTNLLYDDYAHHPDEIKAALRAAKSWFDDKKIVTIFQPHTFSRTKALFAEFTDSFVDSDQIIMLDIFPSAREPYDDSINSKMLVNAMQATHPHLKVDYARNFKQVLHILDLPNLENTVILTMGAGDVYKLHQMIKNEKY